MDLRQIRYFIAVAEAASITKAAEAIGIAQPALSRQVNLLEREFGVKLVTRTSSGTILTNAGEELLARSRPILAALDVMVRDIRAAALGEPIVVRIAVPPYESTYLGLEFIDAMASAAPTVSLKVIEAWTGSIQRMLEIGTADVGVLCHNQIAQFPVKTELTTKPLFLARARRDMPGGESVRVADLAGVELVLPTAENGTREAIEHGFRTAGVRPLIKFETASWPTIKVIVEGGRAAALLSERDALNLFDPAKVATRQLVDPEILTTLFLVGGASMVGKTGERIFKQIGKVIGVALA